jgi:hypothetical protein
MAEKTRRAVIRRRTLWFEKRAASGLMSGSDDGDAESQLGTESAVRADGG